MRTKKTEILICGAGIIGLTIARELIRRGHRNIRLIEKEQELGMHASGRNSGVLHAGIYYGADTLKARTCLEGNRLMKEFCRAEGVPLLENGKVIVAKSESEIGVLTMLAERAAANGARVELIDDHRLKEIEPNAKTVRQALYSYETAVTEPKRVLEALHRYVSDHANILLGTRFIGLADKTTADTTTGRIHFDLFINAAGAYADQIAHMFDVAHEYRLVPFKGRYQRLRPEKREMVRTNIYPVPDLKFPFLGIHLTKSVTGDVYIGPTATPALGRESYETKNINCREAAGILGRDAELFLRNAAFRRLAIAEFGKHSPHAFFADVSAMMYGLEAADLESSPKVGIRAQLVNWQDHQLEMDFKIVKQDNSLHILNAISPAFTSSMSFASLACNLL